MQLLIKSSFIRRQKFLFVLKRSISKITQPNPNQKDVSNVEEITIKVPWGHISGQWWGNKSQRPIVALAGWRECSSSFDPLASILSRHIPILSIDLPGVGYSSHLPAGVAYNSSYSLDSLQFIKRHFKWQKMSLLGHSMGSGINFLFASCYPDQIDFNIGIDGLVLPHTRKEIIAKIYRQNLDNLFAILDTHSFVNGCYRSKNPKYLTYNEACTEAINMTFGSLDAKFAPLLLERELVEVDINKYLFRMDPRVHLRMPGWSREHFECYAQSITVPFLNIKAKNWRYVEGEDCYHNIAAILSEKNKRFQTMQLDGAHHLHITKPESVAPYILEFVEKYDQDGRFNK